MIIQAKPISIMLLLLVSLGLVVLGLWGLHIDGEIYATTEVLKSELTFLLSIVALVEVVYRMLGIQRLWVAAFGAILVMFLTNNAWSSLVVIWIALTSVATGQIIRKLLQINTESFSHVLLALCGIGVLGTGIGLLAHYRVAYPALYVLLLGLPIIFERQYLIDAWKHNATNLRRPAKNNAIMDLAIVCGIYLHLRAALMPEIGHDALAMHMFIPHYVAHNLQWAFDVDKYVWAVMPALADWIYTISYLLGGEFAARLTNFGFMIIICKLLWEMVFWAGGENRSAQWAVVIFLFTPLTYTESSSLFIELIWTAFLVASIYAFMKYLFGERKEKSLLYLASILLGFAFAAKAITLYVALVLMLIYIVSIRTWWQKEQYQTYLAAIAIILLTGGVPYVTAWVITGNPVFPFFNQIFNSPFWPNVAFEAPAIFQNGINWDSLYRITFDSQNYLEARPGASGFQWVLLFPVACLILAIDKNWRAVSIIGLGIASVFLVFQSTSYLRYVFPLFALMCVPLGVALSAPVVVERNALASLMLLVAWMAVSLNFVFFKSGTYYGEVLYGAIFTQSGRQDYIQRSSPMRRAVAIVNEVNLFETPVAVFAPATTAGINSEVLYVNWYNYKFAQNIKKTKDPQDVVNILRKYGSEYIVITENWVPEQVRDNIMKISRLIAEVRGISVRVIKSEYLFKEETLSDPGFESGNEWLQTGKPFKPSNGEVIVNVQRPVTQIIDVIPGVRYQNTVTARCAAEMTQGRVQVNWLDAGSNFLAADIKVFDCSNESQAYVMEVAAPKDAAKAVVYAVGHTNADLIVEKVSFRK